MAENGHIVSCITSTIYDAGSIIDIRKFIDSNNISILGHFGNVKWFIYKNIRFIVQLSGYCDNYAEENESSNFFADIALNYINQLNCQVVVGYGGNGTIRKILGQAKKMGATTVFDLHNCMYGDPSIFKDVTFIKVPSTMTAEHYGNRFGLHCLVVPNPINLQRIVAEKRKPTYVVFVNPTLEKGLMVVCRIAYELGKKRPEILF